MKIPVAILGATGSVGRSFVRLLENHPWFQVAEVAASNRSSNKLYRTFVPDSHVGDLLVKSIEDPLTSQIVFSGLDASVAGEVELNLAKSGHVVVSNCRNHRLNSHVPLIIPEVNPDQLLWLEEQPYEGKIITNPNCVVIGLALSLKPLVDCFGVECVHVVTMQAMSGAGLRARKSLDIEDNIIPYIDGEEEKIEKELSKVLGITQVSAHSNRVPVTDGHTLCVSVKLKKEALLEEVVAAWNDVESIQLPSAPSRPVYYFSEENYPQPKHHRMLEGGMSISIGRARKCSILDFKYVTLSHNTIRGAAGCAILNAELFISQSKRSGASL